MKVKLTIIITVMLMGLGVDARFIEADPGTSNAVVVESSWNFKSWAKSKIKEANKVVKTKYGVDVIHEVRLRVDDEYKNKVSLQEAKAIAAKKAELKELAKAAEKKNKINELKQSLPSYQAEETIKSMQSVSELKKQISTGKFLNVVDQGIKADPSLKTKKSGVPFFSIYKTKKVKSKKGRKRLVKIKVKDLPKLNIGREAKISKNDFAVDDLKILTPNYELAKPLPKIAKLSRKQLNPWLKMKMKKLKGPKGLKFKENGLNKVVTMEMIDKINPAMNTALKTEFKKFDKLKKNQLKMLSALLLYNDGGNCHAVSGIFDDLSTVPGFAQEANFHLGVCAHEMGFYSESTKRLSQVLLTEDEYYTPKALGVLTKYLPREYEINVARAIKSIKNKSLISDTVRDDVHFILSRAASKERNFSEAMKWANLVSQQSKQYPKALFIRGVSEYASGNSKKAIASLLSARKWMSEKGISNKNLESLISIDLGRMQFQARNFKKSHEEYLMIHKDHPLWVSALIEQGWSQILLGDSSGAIGNMYSLHSPYFNAVFMPESFAVRTIGYLNICQYGDAFQTLKMMESKYLPWRSNVASYIRKNKKHQKYYSTLIQYLSKKSTTNVDGLPYQVIREMARRRNFLNLQDSLNQKADELDQFRFISSYIKSDTAKTKKRIRTAARRMKNLKLKIRALKKVKDSQDKVAKYKSSLKRERRIKLEREFKLSVLDFSRKGFYKMRKRVTKRLKGERFWLKNQASKTLQANLKRMKREMDLIVENNEFLRYEVFSGSGENIRYLAAGGKTSGANRLPASIQPKKALTWSVTGEYWEDELGSYRSALKNNCPKRRNYQLPKVVGQNTTVKK